MASPPILAKTRFTLLALVIAGAIALAQWKGWLPGEVTSRKRGNEQVHPPGSRKFGAWEELHGCTLQEDRSNDGDSFLVAHDGRTYTLRLYFADCPEKYRHAHNGDRLAEQGKYFGGLTEAETVAIGEDARDFSLGRLREQPFTVLTRWERVFDSERFYAFVTVDQGDLAELLVARGLARIYTKGENRPGGRSVALEKQQLQVRERKAKAARLGGWAQR